MAKASIIIKYYIIILSLFGVESDYAPIIHPFCNDTFTYKPNSTFQINLEALLSSLTSVAGQNDDGYSTAVEGWGTTDSISGQILCRGDVTPATCQDCVDVAAKDIARLCPNQTESIIFYDYCWLRYTNQSFKFDSVIASGLVNVNSASDESKFKQVLSELLNDVAEKAANLQSSSGKKFGTHEVEYRSGEKMYGLGQCTPDLTLSECKTCFRTAIAYIGTCCAGKMGGRVLLAGCNIRYEMYAFYNVTTESAPPQLPPPIPPPPTGKSDTGSSKVVVAIVVPIIVLAWKEWNDGTPIEVLDPFLLESCSQIEVIRCVQIGLLCVQENPDDRPTMAEIVSYFSNTSIELPFPKQPAFFMHSTENPTMAADLEYLGQFSQSSKPSSTNEMSKSELLPR
ncbi:cysteine-rich receptor-like protein kinase 15 isoform X1 [Senna tora]|uniref:Cysteine-rich receptor-like protein kinase 15 isoform X1 n=1 Tax=Senna tora TaxID=362788 RepID=A0A834SWI7_9FABA|nr:cysteine-rich receptor-like protein kinase 15 isoform X1 [Senna tora]